MNADLVVRTLLEDAPEEEDASPKELFQQAMDSPKGQEALGQSTITIDSLHGEIVFDATGTVVLRNTTDMEEWPYEQQPARLDLETWRRENPGQDPLGCIFDPGDWAWWTSDGRYVESGL